MSFTSPLYDLTSIFLCIFMFIVVGYLCNLILKFVSKEDRPFFALANFFGLGMIVVVVLASCFMTSLKTGFILFIPLFIFLSIYNKDLKAYKITSFSTRRFPVFMTCSFVLIGFGMSFFRLYDIQGQLSYTMFIDYAFYKQVGNAMFLAGQENTSEVANILEPLANEGVVPYHFFEIWLSALLSKVFFKPFLSVFQLYLPTFFISFFLLAIMVFFEKVRDVKWYYGLLAIFLLFVGNAYLSFYDYLPWNGYQSAFTSAGYIPFSVKLYIPLFFMFLGVMQLSSNRYGNLLVLLCMLSIASFATFPATMTALYLILLYFLIWGKDFKTNKPLIYLPFIFPILVLLFYFLFASTSKISSHTQYDVEEYLLWKVWISHFLIRPMYYFLPLLIILLGLLFKRNITRNQYQNDIVIFMLMIGMTAGGGLGASLFMADPNAIQIIILPIHGLSYVVLVYLLVRTSFRLHFAPLTIVVILSMVNIYNFIDYFRKKSITNTVHSAQYITKNNQISDKTELIAVLFDTQNPFNFVMYNSVGKEFAYQDSVFLVRLPNVISEFEALKPYANTSTFHHFFYEHNYKIPEDLHKAQIDFLKKYNISYLLVQKGQELSPLLKNLVVDKYEDTISGNTVYKLDMKNN